MQTDMSYIIFSVFCGKKRRFYREPILQYMINNKEKPANNLIYVVHSDLDSIFLFNVDYPDEENTI